MANFVNGSVVNEKNHKKVKRMFLIGGIAMIVVALFMMTFGVIKIVQGAKILGEPLNFQRENISREDPDWFDKTTSQDKAESDAKQERATKGMANLIPGVLLTFFGLPLIAGGITLVARANMRELAAFGVSSVAPVVGDTVEYANQEIVPGVAEATKTIIGGVVGGVAGGVTEGKNTVNQVKCSACGKANSKKNKFCKYCGAELSAKAHCTQCGAELSSDSDFCSNCGSKVEK